MLAAASRATSTQEPFALLAELLRHDAAEKSKDDIVLTPMLFSYQKG
jgi:hypothetical protein